MKTQAELRAFAWGMTYGVGVVLATFVIISEIAGVRWQPVKVGVSDAARATKPYPSNALPYVATDRNANIVLCGPTSLTVCEKSLPVSPMSCVSEDGTTARSC